MFLPILRLMAIYAVYSCNENVCSSTSLSYSQRENGVCDKYCNIGICGFDQVGLQHSPSTSPCISECDLTSCGEALRTNDQCDESCNKLACGFDWGKCGYCAKGCNI